MYARAVAALSSTLLLAAVCVSCSEGEPSSRPAATPSATGTTPTSPTVAPEGSRSEEVRFRAADGDELVGRVWSDGDVAVILAHGFSPGSGQDGWLPFPDILAERGYGVLTFNFGGFCASDGCSEGGIQLGENWRDLTAAIDFIEGRGTKTVFLIGASMGGLAVLRAASMPEVEVAGVVSLATPQFPSKYYYGEPAANDVTPGLLRQIMEPKLFVAGKDDVQTPGEAPLRPGIEVVRFADDAQRMFDAAADPKQLALVDSGSHSSDLITTAEDEIVTETRALIFRFLEANS
jgi:pimeloyl-ACP methyl ester carboxylesterase